ncbi:MULTISPECIES: ATP-binding protein [unclassified Burkholderia]|uniref:ATP-binding protein n=1 Tax=unclassified Burkholderia TaxID=2613784 RepID=UPI00141D9928|nr:CHASE2 domain-containing protein [Burkholderia sp. Tr-860]NIF63026.1 CHASE2 domain-containing protein [Burkholderia sp. Cy-647]NIF95153.1 CHASE2 domain-containing protein [Burkholderia sp. Ax-1720]
MLDRFIRGKREAKRAWTSSWTVAVALLACSALSYTPDGESLFAPFDLLHWQLVAHHEHGAHGDAGRVVTVVIDARTLEALGPATVYARETHARLLDRLRMAASVSLDFPMVNRQPGDAMLARAIARHGRVVLTAQSNGLAGRVDLLVAPPPALANAAAAVGQRKLVFGSGHTVQGIVPFLAVGPAGFEEAHVSRLALQVAEAVPALRNLRGLVQAHVSSMGRVVPGALALSFPNDFDLRQYSYLDVLEGRVPEAAFAGRVVFVGDTATGLSGGPYHLSARGAPLTRVQIDAQAADELLDGKVVLRVPFVLQILFGLAAASGMILICARASGRRSNAMALAWMLAIAAALTALPMLSRYWIPLGPALASCVAIYAVYGWRRAAGVRRMLRHELDGLHAAGLPLAAEGHVREASPDDELDALVQGMRASRTAYVDLIRSLPYPVFVERGAKLVLSNERGRELVERLAAAREPAIMMLAREQIRLAKAAGEIRTLELNLGGRAQMMMVTPFGEGGEGGEMSEAADASDMGSMICLVDVHDIKAAAEHDRMTLRHMAHDLRNPLSTMLSLLEARGMGDGDGKGEAPDLIADLHQLVDYSLRVAQDFTQLSRAEHLDARSYQPLSAADLAAEAIDQVWHGAAAKRIAIDGPRIDDGDAWVLGSPDMLLRALVNLLDNAIKYSAPDTRIEVRLAPRADDVAIGIEDQGCGVAAEAMPHLFEPFFQVGGTRGDPALGVGLGLPFVRAVVARHGGTVEASSTPGVGSRFTIALPRTETVLLDA